MLESISMITQSATPTRPNAQQIAAGQKMEAHFLAEMLNLAGLNDQPEGFGGGHGEDQFASFLRREQAQQITDAGGIGLAEAIARSLYEAEEK